jgi:predicted O-methyltransferase YrrM
MRFQDALADLAARRAAAVARRSTAALPRDAPADVVVDFLFAESATAIGPWQIKEEFLALARLVEQRRPRTLLEIGTAEGGTLFAHARLAHEEARIISIDLPQGPFGGGYPRWRIPLYQSFAGARQKLELLRVDSHAESTAALLASVLAGRLIDYAFIDGDHTYDGVRQDFELCRRFAAPNAMIAFHDIAQQPNSEYVAATGAQWAVHEFWKQLRQSYAHDEFIRDPAQEGYGIGVVYLDRPLANERTP